MQTFTQPRQKMTAGARCRRSRSSGASIRLKHPASQQSEMNKAGEHRESPLAYRRFRFS